MNPTKHAVICAQIQQKHQLRESELLARIANLEAQRTWVGLTDEERWDCLEVSRRNADCRDALVKAVEAKLKEKNT